MDEKDTAPPVPETLLGALGISSLRRLLLFLACAVAALALAALPGPELEPAARRALFILVLAASLWVTEAIPAFAVGILVIGLQVALLGRPGGVYAVSGREWEEFVSVIGHPLVWLFFGGFVLACGMEQTGLDRRLASRVLSRTGGRPGAVLLGVMGISFVLSMFMSNTATTAMMVAMTAPLIASLERDDPFAPGLLLGIATAANLGGMGSLIGSPPNAIAVGALAELPGGPSISFLEWMALGLPFALVLFAIAWLLISWRYPARAERVSLPPAPQDAGERSPLWQMLVVAATLVVTVGLWLSSGWHGLPTAVVSFLPIVLLTLTGVIGAHEVRGLNWDVLLLLAGGLALGSVVTSTGLSGWIVERLPVDELGPLGAALVMAYLCVVLSNFMSNTAAANVLVPIGVSMAATSPQDLVLPIAFAASAAMCLPIATPPNALVYAAGRVETRDFMRMGLLMGALAPGLAVAWLALIR